MQLIFSSIVDYESVILRNEILYFFLNLSAWSSVLVMLVLSLDLMFQVKKYH